MKTFKEVLLQQENELLTEGRIPGIIDITRGELLRLILRNGGTGLVDMYYIKDKNDSTVEIGTVFLDDDDDMYYMGMLDLYREAHYSATRSNLAVRFHPMPVGEFESLRDAQRYAKSRGWKRI